VELDEEIRSALLVHTNGNGTVVVVNGNNGNTSSTAV